MTSCKYSEIRNCNEISSKVNARYFLGNFLSLGTVKNISGHCICINTDMCIPLGSRIELLIPLKTKHVLSVPVSVWRFENTNSIYATMSVEVFNPFKEYLEFAGSFNRNRTSNGTLEVSEETLKQTTKCQLDFKCLTGNRNMCLIDRPVNGNGLFIKERRDNMQNCPYSEFSELSAYVCNCPTRYEIYTRYNM